MDPQTFSACVGLGCFLVLFIYGAVDSILNPELPADPPSGTPSVSFQRVVLATLKIGR